MESIDKEFGELRGEFIYFRNCMIRERDKMEEKIDENHKELLRKLEDQVIVKLQEVKDELSLYKTIYKIVKFFLGGAVLLLAFKFGDIRLLYQSLFG